MLKSSLSIGQSNYLTTILILIHGGALSAVWLTELPWWLSLFLSILCIVSLLYTLYRHGLRWSPRAIISIKQNIDNSWTLTTKRGELLNATLCGDSLKTTFLVILNFKTHKWRPIRPVVIFCDATSRTLFRQLRVHLWAMTSLQSNVN